MMFRIFSDDFNQGLCRFDMFAGTSGEYLQTLVAPEPATYAPSFPSVSLQPLWELPGCNLKLTSIQRAGRWKV